MIHYNSDDLTAKQQYKFLSGSIVPRPIAWITTLTADGNTVNLAPFSFFSGVSNELPLVSIAIIRKNGELKDSARNLLATKEAVIHIVDETLVEQMNQTSANLPADQSEATLANLTLIDSQSTKVPSLEAAKIRFEASLYNHLPITNEANEIITDLFILKVSDFYFADSVFNSEKEYILTKELAPVARLAGNNYATLAEEYTIVRPS
ncbi:flavin reductase family protein [Carnobacterium gallinarum]|uniref:flavin reductase family protein n=1 Tax=Carnobacterium gallinarum TaxID=2749 RepID=UPI000555F4BB|nr:flavin reductase family protein [Carnobacterium gallinarum]